MRKGLFTMTHFRVLATGFAAVMFVTGAPAQSKKPNVVYFLVDNLGMGEISAYSGGPYRGVSTPASMPS
jgi:arylsulfatase